jgi:putative alpha-1,2-mannosidase
LDFAQHNVIGLVSELHHWKKRFLERYPDNTDERRKRLGEAIISLRWEVAQPRHEITWIKNHDGDPDRTSLELFRVATLNTRTADLSRLAYDSLAIAKSLL